MIWHLLSRRNYIVVTGNRQQWQSLDYRMPIDVIKKAISRIEVELQATEMEIEAQREADEFVESVKNYLTTGK
jgi:ribose 5-phosphate isomerase